MTFNNYTYSKAQKRRAHPIEYLRSDIKANTVLAALYCRNQNGFGCMVT
jgi:hypothetical protein